MKERGWLAPVGFLYGTAAAARAGLYRRGWLTRTRLDAPVVSVGNLTVGGSGKTPLVCRVARMLGDMGAPVAILSRGYGGTFRSDALVVSDGERVRATAREAGDEPVMLARELPGTVVAVGRRRDVVGRAVLRRFGPRVLLLDDGFQHLRLARDLDLLCVDATERPRRPLPAGPLREFPRAADRADLILLTQAHRATPEQLEAQEQRFGAHRTLRATRRVLGFFDLDGRPAATPTRPFLLAGIAGPERFAADAAEVVAREALASAGARVSGRALFADHHAFTAAELARVTSHAHESGADAVVTTAKDAVRLPPGDWRPRILVLRIAAELADDAPLVERLRAVASRLA